MLLNQFLLLAAVLFCIGVYGVMARKNGVMVLLSIELILNAVNLNLVAFGAKWASDPSAAACAAGQPCPATIGHVFGLFVIAVAAAEVGVGLAIVLMLFRNRKSVDIDELDLMKG
jgi:NADH:ubiquinone oxidoreductase subunit K